MGIFSSHSGKGPKDDGYDSERRAAEARRDTQRRAEAARKDTERRAQQAKDAAKKK